MAEEHDNGESGRARARPLEHLRRCFSRDKRGQENKGPGSCYSHGQMFPGAGWGTDGRVTPVVMGGVLWYSRGPEGGVVVAFPWSRGGALPVGIPRTHHDPGPLVLAGPLRLC